MLPIAKELTAVYREEGHEFTIHREEIKSLKDIWLNEFLVCGVQWKSFRRMLTFRGQINALKLSHVGWFPSFGYSFLISLI